MLAILDFCHKRSILLCSKINFLFFWISERGNICLSFSWRSTHHITRNALVLPLDILLVTVVYWWLWIMSGWTHINSRREVGTETKPFSSLWWESVLITFSSSFRMRITTTCTDGRSPPNWRDVIVVVEIIYLVYFFKALSLWKLEFVTLMKQLE